MENYDGILSNSALRGCYVAPIWYEPSIVVMQAYAPPIMVIIVASLELVLTRHNGVSTGESNQ